MRALRRPAVLAVIVTGVWLALAAAVGSAAVAKGLRELTPEQLAGQRTIYSYGGSTPPPELLRKIAAGQAAGVIFFSENITSTSQLASVVKQLEQANKRSPVDAPLLLMVDQEGGRVKRLPGPPDLSAKAVGLSPAPLQAASEAGRGAGLNLGSLGLNVNLAPVLGVYRKPGDFLDQYERSFSSDPATVASLGSRFVTAQQATGVAATIKHFPGLGAANADDNTDLRPVTVATSKQELRSVDEQPFRAAIAARAKLAMLSWATYPALDPSRPAGLSPIVVNDELRKRLGFKGVTITDAIEAGGLRAFGTQPQRGLLAAKAGMDLILYSGRDVAQADAGERMLAEALRSGQLDKAAFEASVIRILDLRRSLG